MVLCPLCKREMKHITNKHIRMHSLTLQEFKTQFPQSVLIHPEIAEKIKQARIEGKRKKENLLVEKPCWNNQICGNIVPVNINVGNKSVTCGKCRSEGAFHPDVIKQKQILSERAKEINKNRDIINKRTESLRNRTPEEIKDWKDKREKTLIEKDGDQWKQIQSDKTKAGLFRLYGKEHALQVDEFKQQAQETYFLNSGYKNPMYNPEVVKKVFLKRDQEKITEKTIETNIEKYGGPSPMNSNEIIDKANYTRFINQEERVLKYLKEIGFVLLGDYKCAHQKAIFKHVGGCGYEWETYWNNLWNYSRTGPVCPNCKPKNTNHKITQKNLQIFFEELGFKPVVDNRILLGDGREIDFIIEEEKVAIEYCGLYWHSDEMIGDTRKKINDPRTYHLSKLELCEKKGYRLITIFEDEWVEKKEIVKTRLKQILNKSTATRVHARECKIFEVSRKAKNDFLEEFHIQGSSDGATLSYGAFDSSDNLISIMTFGRPRGVKNATIDEWEIKRFCSNSNYHSTGIASKLLEHFKNNHKWKYIVSFADRRWSNGNLYEMLGFKLVNKGSPTPWFLDVNKVKRHHRSKMWKTQEDIETGLTQEQLAVIKGYKTIHDCGHLKYVLKNSL